MFVHDHWAFKMKALVKLEDDAFTCLVETIAKLREIRELCSLNRHDLSLIIDFCSDSNA